MVVRLAEKQGLLSQKKLTIFQEFALIYFTLMDRRQKIADDEDFVKHYTAIMDPVRFRQVYMRETLQEDFFEEVPGYEVEPDDFEDIDRWLSQLDQTRTARG